MKIADSDVPAIEMFSALRAMCQVFIRRKTRERLLKFDRWASIAAVFEKSTELGNAVEYYSVSDRYALIQGAKYLLENWPDNFLSEMIEGDVSRFHFFGATHIHPPWVDAVINKFLAKQNRWVTEADVRRVVSDLRKEGKLVSKGEVWRRLNWFGPIAKDWLV